jgi:hypothetical protein
MLYLSCDRQRDELSRGGGMRLFFWAAIWTMLTTAVHADDVTAMGAGTGTCGQYTKTYKTSPEATDRIVLGWINGFLSGLNTAALMRKEPPRKLGTYEEHQEYLHKYCDAHPLKEVGAAGVALFLSLPVQTPKN